MARRPVIESYDEVRNWINAGKAIKKDSICSIRAASGTPGRSRVGQWIVIGAAEHIPAGSRFLIKRSADSATAYVELDSPGGDNDKLAIAGSGAVAEGDILSDQQADIQNGVMTLHAIDDAVSTSAKAVAMAKDSIETLERQNAQLAAASEDRSKAEFYRAMSLVAQRVLNMLSQWRQSPNEPENRKEFIEYQEYKAHLIARAGVAIDEVPAEELATILQVYKNDPRFRQMISDVRRAQVQDLTSVGAGMADNE